MIPAPPGADPSQQQQQQPPQSTAPAVVPRDKSGDDAKLIFGTVFSLRNMARKLGGDDDAFIAYRTAHYKLHYYETPTNLRFALLTEPGALSMRNVLHQIYINLWIEYGKQKPRPQEVLYMHVTSCIYEKYFPRIDLILIRLLRDIVVKNPLSPVEHKGGAGVRNEMFEIGLDKFIRGLM